MIKLIPLLILVACASGGSMVTMDSFHEVPIGVSAPEVVAVIGKPYAIREKKDGTVEYEYIERIKIGYRNMDTRRYFIILKDGKVIEKHVKQDSPLPYYLESFDSYDMQTTQNGDSP